MEEFKKLRKQLDAYSQLVGEMRPINNIGVSADVKDFNSDEKKLFELVGFKEAVNSEELKSCEKNLLLAKAWTGKILGEMNDPSPYKNEGQRSEVQHIEPVDAKVDTAPWKERNNWKAKSHIEQVESLRVLIQQALDFIQGFFPDPKGEYKNPRSLAIARTEVETYLIEARFQLGFELHRIKEEAKKPYVDLNTPLYGGITQK